MSKTTRDTQYADGYAAQWVDEHGEIHDLGGGWASEDEAVAELDAQGAEGYEVYAARSADGWRTWDRI